MFIENGETSTLQFLFSFSLFFLPNFLYSLHPIHAGLLRPALHQPGGASHASHSVPPCAGFCAPPCAGPEAPPHIPWVKRTTATCWAHGSKRDWVKLLF